jgi:hypothetical protein
MSWAIISDFDFIASGSLDEEIGGDTSNFTRQLSTQGLLSFRNKKSKPNPFISLCSEKQ